MCGRSSPELAMRKFTVGLPAESVRSWSGLPIGRPVLVILANTAQVVTALASADITQNSLKGDDA
jgi:hypothetical protein